MGMNSYGCYEVKIDEEKLREVCPEGFARLDEILEERGLTFSDVCEAWTEEDEESPIYSATKEIVECVLEKAGVAVKPTWISEDAETDEEREFWAAEPRLAPEIEELGGEIIAWSEIG